MKFLTAVLLAGLLAGSALAQGTPATPPATPPGNPPADDPNNPKEPDPVELRTTNWAPSWQAARSWAAKRNSYAIMFVTLDKDKDGAEAPHTSRLINTLFGNPDIYRKLNDQFGCWKGTMAEAQKLGAGKQLGDAGIKDAPALLFVDPDDGSVVEQLSGHFNWMEVKEVLELFDGSTYRKAIEKKIDAAPANKNDTKLQLYYGNALVRAGEIKEARKAYEIAAKSNDARDKIMTAVGLCWCDLKEKKYKEAIESAQKAFDEMPREAPPRGTCLYIQVMSYYALGELDDCSKVASMLRQYYIRTTYGWKLMDDIVDGGYDFIEKKKVEPPAKPAEKGPNDEPK